MTNFVIELGESPGDFWTCNLCNHRDHPLCSACAHNRDLIDRLKGIIKRDGEKMVAWADAEKTRSIAPSELELHGRIIEMLQHADVPFERLPLDADPEAQRNAVAFGVAELVRNLIIARANTSRSTRTLDAVQRVISARCVDCGSARARGRGFAAIKICDPCWSTRIG